MRTNNTAKKIALCGLMSALAIIIMFLASIIGVGIYAGPMLASFALLPITADYGSRTSFLVYIAVSLIAVFIMPDRELAFFFVCFGWYQAVFPAVCKIKNKTLAATVKLSIYTLIIFIMYGIVIRVLGIDPGFAEEIWMLNAVLFIAGGAIFLMLDKIYAKIIFRWTTDWKKKLFR